ncbi:MAG: dienelactone hydrolase family protein [Rhodospirillales bacterium]|nr:dienelactone hydrolase family protein [Rhodospirillales bacterium]
MGKFVELTAADGHKFDAYRAEPAGAPKGAIVVIQEIFGVNNHIQAVTDGFAADGYLAVAPALYDRAERKVDLGYDEEGRQKGMAVREGVAWDDVVKDIIAARESVSSAGKVGIVGYCYGGTVAWLGACKGGFDAAVGYYGGGIHTMLDLNAGCPVMLHFGEKDQGIPLENVDMIREAKSDADIYVYDGAGHGFLCDERQSYDEAATNLSRGRTLDFFGSNL